MNYCKECGAKVTEEQRFCEQCGAELIEVKEEKKDSEEKTESVPIQRGGLFDLSRNYYLIHEKAWDLGFGEIYDEKGNQIGRMNRIIFSIRRRVELQEMDGTVMATIHSKIISARGAQDLKDAQGNHIARIKRKILTFFKQKFFLEEPVTKTRWYEAEGDFMGWSFRIYSVPDRTLVAEIEKADRWRDVFLGGIFDYADKYALRIHDNETDRRILLGFVLSIDNVLHDNAGMGPMMGPVSMRRRIPGRPGLPFGRMRPRGRW
jgi:uncharacterized protein YxjI